MSRRGRADDECDRSYCVSCRRLRTSRWLLLQYRQPRVCRRRDECSLTKAADKEAASLDRTELGRALSKSSAVGAHDELLRACRVALTAFKLTRRRTARKRPERDGPLPSLLVEVAASLDRGGKAKLMVAGGAAREGGWLGREGVEPGCVWGGRGTRAEGQEDDRMGAGGPKEDRPLSKGRSRVSSSRARASGKERGSMRSTC